MIVSRSLYCSWISFISGKAMMQGPQPLLQKSSNIYFPLKSAKWCTFPSKSKRSASAMSSPSFTVLGGKRLTLISCPSMEAFCSSFNLSYKASISSLLVNFGLYFNDILKRSNFSIQTLEIGSSLINFNSRWLIMEDILSLFVRSAFRSVSEAERILLSLIAKRWNSSHKSRESSMNLLCSCCSFTGLSTLHV